MQSIYHKGASGQGQCPCAQDNLGGLLEEAALKQRLEEFRTGQVEKEDVYTRQRRVCWHQGEISRYLGHKI